MFGRIVGRSWGVGGLRDHLVTRNVFALLSTRVRGSRNAVVELVALLAVQGRSGASGSVGGVVFASSHGGDILRRVAVADGGDASVLLLVLLVDDGLHAAVLLLGLLFELRAFLGFLLFDRRGGDVVEDGGEDAAEELADPEDPQVEDGDARAGEALDDDQRGGDGGVEDAAAVGERRGEQHHADGEAVEAVFLLLGVSDVKHDGHEHEGEDGLGDDDAEDAGVEGVGGGGDGEVAAEDDEAVEGGKHGAEALEDPVEQGLVPDKRGGAVAAEPDAERHGGVEVRAGDVVVGEDERGVHEADGEGREGAGGGLGEGGREGEHERAKELGEDGRLVIAEVELLENGVDLSGDVAGDHAAGVASGGGEVTENGSALLLLRVDGRGWSRVFGRHYIFVELLFAYFRQKISECLKKCLNI